MENLKTECIPRETEGLRTSGERAKRVESRSPSILRLRICILIFGLLAGCQNKPLYKETRVLMGTFIEVTSVEKKAATIVFEEIQRIENLLSKYKPDSEVSRLNKSGKLNVSPDTFFIIKKSIEFWRLSDGGFDITVAGLIDLWGFNNNKYSLPSKENIKSVLRLTGSDKIILNDADNMVELSTLGTKIDLGAIAKGFALDCAVKKLKENNIYSCLINAGGQVYCLGERNGLPWRIAVKNPRGNDILDYLELKDESASTSGDYEQYFIKDGRRYSHILNPKTGYPADSGIISVTVIAPDALVADALSTAIFVIGKEKGEILAKKIPNVRIKIIEEKNVFYNE